MPNMTVRNIPDDIFDKLKTLSILEKRSMNNEILVVLEKGVAGEMADPEKAKQPVSKDTQLDIWDNLSGKWEDSRTTDEITTDIVRRRTRGRGVIL